ncbi:MAG: putative toxin-antitoxin system toxin component, PIN family [Chloroflexi bacterium]|nr:putative toxin-antitoxin system toxin component, PIN family [Chloroflexota bacterium]
MIRAVIDTNLIISYLLTQSETTSQLIAHWERGNFVYVISPAMLNELKEVVQRPRLRQHIKGDPAILLDLIEMEAELALNVPTLVGICRDPKDDPIIACAVGGQAAYLVTGDADLLTMVTYQGVTMMRVYDFVNLLNDIETKSR